MSDLFNGFIELENELKEYLQFAKEPQSILEIGAAEFIKDLNKLPKPMSEIRKTGYTHIVRTFAYRKAKNNQIEAGWGKYYGPMLEHGTKFMKANAHLEPCWNRNKEKYYNKMLQKL